MKKITGIIMATTLSVSLAVGALGCGTTAANTTTPGKTTPPTTTTPSQPVGQTIAEKFIRDSSTFKFDGIADSIVLVKDLSPTLDTVLTEGYTFGYQTGHPGHGDRTGQVLAQVVTNHSVTIFVNLTEGKVISAICDEKWDMVKDQKVTAAIPDGLQTLAIDFIKNSSTFKFDGILDSLKIDSTEVEDNEQLGVPDYIFTITYQTRHGGHGDRTGQNVTQVISNHRAVVTVRNGQILSAICDGTYDLQADLTVVTEEAGRQLAEDFIQNGSTFKFDGIAGSIKYIQTYPGWTSAFKSTSFTFEFQTGHPGHGDRAGQVLAQVITNHKAVILIKDATREVVSAVCDGSWDMIKENDLPVYVSGIIISGGDTTPADGPQDAPRTFTYKIQKADGTFINVSYTAYPPSPVGDANQAKITLDFNGGTIQIGDKMEALGMLDKETNTLVVAEEGNFIKTSVPKLEVLGKVISGGDTSAADGPQDTPRKFVYKIQKEDGTYINVSYMAYPPSPAGDAAMAKITLSYYDGSPEPGDYMKAFGTYDKDTDTVVVVDQGDYIKTYPEKP